MPRIVQRTKIGDVEPRGKGGFETSNDRRNIATQDQIIHIHRDHRVLTSDWISASVEAGLVVAADKALLKEEVMQGKVPDSRGLA